MGVDEVNSSFERTSSNSFARSCGLSSPIATRIQNACGGSPFCSVFKKYRWYSLSISIYLNCSSQSSSTHSARSLTLNCSGRPISTPRCRFVVNASRHLRSSSNSVRSLPHISQSLLKEISCSVFELWFAFCARGQDSGDSLIDFIDGYRLVEIAFDFSNEGISVA